MLRKIAGGISRRLRKGASIPFTNRRISLSIDRREEISRPAPAAPPRLPVETALDAMALDITLGHINRLLTVCPALERYRHPAIGTDLATAQAFLNFCNDTVALYSPASRNVHLRRQLVALKGQVAGPDLRTFIEKQIAIHDLEDGVVERAAILAADPHHEGLYASELAAFDANYQAAPPFLSEAWHGLNFSGDVRGNSILWFIRRNVELYRGKRILHLGPEVPVRLFFQDPGNAMDCLYETSDGFSAIVDHLADVTALGLSSQAYDVVICHRVLEHVLDDRAALREIARVLKAGGMLDISVPQSMNRENTVEWLAQDSSHHDHVRHYGRDFALRVAEAGFAVTVDPSLLERSLEDHNRAGTYPMRHYICRKLG